jgi:hypothetical protein
MLTVGSRGSDVRHLQQVLNRNGAHLTVDGDFGPATKRAVIAYQRSHGLTSDGVVGDKTGQSIFHSRNKDLWDGVDGAGGATGGGKVPKTVQDCAKFLLNSKNVSFWTGLSTGSDRKNFERLARGQQAFVPATGRHVTPNLRLMQALVAMAKKGPIMINALTGGRHSPNSNHYRGVAVDLDVSTGNAGMIERTANQFGGRRNFERDHIHLDF